MLSPRSWALQRRIPRRTATTWRRVPIRPMIAIVSPVNPNRAGNMKLHAPTILVFLSTLALAVLAVTGYFATVTFITHYQFWILLAGFVVLALGCIV